IVVSQTTTRFDAPNPVTYASTSLVFSLALIRNMRSAGIGTPACFVKFSIAATSSGLVACKGSNLLNIGSMSHGLMNTMKSTTGSAANHRYSHQRRGLRRISEERMSAKISANPTINNFSLLQFDTHDPQFCTDIS